MLGNEEKRGVIVRSYSADLHEESSARTATRRKRVAKRKERVDMIEEEDLSQTERRTRRAGNRMDQTSKVGRAHELYIATKASHGSVALDAQRLKNAS